MTWDNGMVSSIAQAGPSKPPAARLARMTSAGRRVPATRIIRQSSGTWPHFGGFGLGATLHRRLQGGIEGAHDEATTFPACGAVVKLQSTCISHTVCFHACVEVMRSKHSFLQEGKSPGTRFPWPKLGVVLCSPDDCGTVDAFFNNNEYAAWSHNADSQ